jgi:hypothetical protein
MTTRYDLLSARKNGDKTYWTKVGSMFPAREGDGFTIKLDALPLPNEKGEVWVAARVPRERDDQPQRTAKANELRSAVRGGSTAADIGDDIPFNRFDTP